MTARYACCDRNRRADVLAHASLNGIDFLEVDATQRVLRVAFLRPPSAALLAIAAENVTVEGGVRVRGIVVGPVVWEGDVLRVTVDRPGDFSTYTLRLADATGEPFADLDPLFAAVEFSFKVACPTDSDCLGPRGCPPEPREEPEIDYLARDYAGFRQLMLDRLAVLVPAWTDRNPADIRTTLVELLAYVGDRLSYQQDAIATEAYLGTARLRTSVRRHARLLDYRVHDGCNARTWAHVRVTAGSLVLPAGTQIMTRVVGLTAPRLEPDSRQHAEARAAHPTLFETMHAATLRAAHNAIPFYTWGDESCCLPRGATAATLAADLPELRQGDVLVLAEQLGPRTGEHGDADPRHRQAVRLSEAPRVITDPLTGTRVTEIVWHDQDALTFPLCLSARTEAGALVNGVSVALGNVVLADHGETTFEDALVGNPRARDGARFRVPPGSALLAAATASSEDPCADEPRAPLAPRFRPRLARGPLTFAATVDRQERGRRLAFDPDASAAAAFVWRMEDVFPALTDVEDSDGGVWAVRRDLLGSGALARELVTEVDDDGRATLRFGDGEYGARPAAGQTFSARYRVGNGSAGNVGANALYHLVSADDGIAAVTNPLPAAGGVDREPLEDVRQKAPAAFRIQERAVTAADYAEVAGRHPEVQRAAATIRWTGSWRTVFLTIDRLGGGPVDAAFEADLRAFLERYRMAGQDIEIDGPRDVPLQIDLRVCVLPGYFRSDVRAALLEALGSRGTADGQRGLFHPDNFTFGQPVYLSRVQAAAQAVSGVRFVEVTRFERLGQPDPKGLDEGALAVGSLEIARLDGDPNFPERGILRVALEGGR